MPVGVQIGGASRASRASRATFVLAACSCCALAAGAGCAAHVPRPRLPAEGTASPAQVAPAARGRGGSPATASTIAYLSAFGATAAAWAANHTLDPRGTGGYWPRLPDGEDTYTGLVLAGGRVVGYSEHLDPTLGESAATAVALDELPVDASLVRSHVVAPAPGSGRGCDQLLFASPTLSAVLHAGALVELWSTGSSFDPLAVSGLSYSALPTASPFPPACRR